MARKGATIKGVKGFSKHPVVAIAPNGDAKHFDSITAAQRFLKYPKKSPAVLKAIQRKYPVRGYKIMYEEDWSPLGDYCFRLPCDRDFDGHPTTALRRQSAIRAWQNKTEEERQKIREWGREHVRKMRAEGKWPKGHKPVPVYCLTLKKFFPSITDAAKELGVSLSAICQAMKRNRPVHGFKLYRKSVWDKITQKK